MISVYALHSNPSIFENPQVFDPSRFNEKNEVKIPDFGYVPFSVGSRRCPGRQFALHMIKVVSTTIYVSYFYLLYKS